MAVSGVTGSSFNTSAAVLAVADATGANASDITVTVSDHEVNATLYLFYLSSVPQLTFSIQALLMQSLELNISSTPGLGSASATAGLSFTLGTVSVTTAEAASEATNGVEAAVARRSARRSLLDKTLLALQVPVSVSGFSSNTAFATGTSTQLNTLLDSTWLYVTLAAAFLNNGVALDSLSGNQPTVSAILSVAIKATDEATATRWSTAMARVTADSELSDAFASRLRFNVSVLRRSLDLRFPVDAKKVEDKVVAELRGAPLAGVIIGAGFAGIVIVLLCCILCVQRRRLKVARQLKEAQAAKMDTPLDADTAAGEASEEHAYGPSFAVTQGREGSEDAPAPQEKQRRRRVKEDRVAVSQEEAAPEDVEAPVASAAAADAPPRASPCASPSPAPAAPLRDDDPVLLARAETLARQWQADIETRARAKIAAAEASALDSRARAAESARRAAKAEEAIRAAEAKARAAQESADALRAAAEDYASRLSTAEAALSSQAPAWASRGDD
jgi:hypothetical protein